MEDINYCVYLHRRVDNGDIVYVGEGREARAKNVSKSSCRNKDHCKILTETALYCEFYKQGLTKEEAEKLEAELIAQYKAEGHPLTNKNRYATNAQAYFRYEFEDLFILDPESPSGLRWKTDRYNLKGNKGAIIVRGGDIAGSKNKLTGYWQYINKACHRIVYALVHGECPEQLTVDHIDGNKSNNSIDNLQLLSRGDNSRKSHIGRTYPQGDDVHSSKVTSEQVLLMYQMFQDYKTNEEVGKYFNLHERYISLVRHGRRWKELYNEYGVKFRESSQAVSVSLEQVRSVLELLPTKNNLEISKITGVERSSVSRLRHGKTLHKLVSIVKEQQSKQINER